MNNLRLLSAVILFGVLASPAVAEEAKTKAPENPLEIVQKATSDMMKGLDENQTKQFSAINNSFVFVRTVEDSQQSIALAVESCSKVNPDLKDGMSARFETWKENIRPVVKKAKTKLDKMILLQNFAQPSQVRTYLKKIDAAFVYRNQKLKPVPITRADDCKKLQSGMDKTQKDMVDLLTETLNLNADLKVKEE